ncbi:uncharacterized protein LOC127588393 isoform X1 [Hippocampus zosterae]|uniref:uncharacterized protein LOC127588393 isoform X1 n=1 Tax=Hippocampus zosterae TaxID=109293 RepID=UPI00223DC221|nr:uncharacterized protein LOC127588393 isoform X1 [Hippocampus zosterae]
MFVWLLQRNDTGTRRKLHFTALLVSTGAKSSILYCFCFRIFRPAATKSHFPDAIVGLTGFFLTDAKLLISTFHDKSNMLSVCPCWVLGALVDEILVGDSVLSSFSMLSSDCRSSCRGCRAMELLRVAVIGAGAAGLCAARHVLSRPERFAPPVVFELTADVGGTWRYQERVGPDVRCSMYKNLRTNLPKEVMMFPDFPFDPQLNSFLSHQDVRRYLEDYCRRYRIRPHIKFRSAVEEVKPVAMTTEDAENGTRTTWEVTACDASGCRTTATFDAVFVCSGHYSEPNVPSVPGLENFKGSPQSLVQERRSLLVSLGGGLGSQSVGRRHFLGARQSGRPGDAESPRSPFGGRSSGWDPPVESAGGRPGRWQNLLSGRLGARRRRAALLHGLQLQLSFPGRRPAGLGAGGAAGGAALPLHDAARLSLARLHRALQEHLPLRQLPLPGPVRAWRSGRLAGAAVASPDGGGGAARAAEEGRRRCGAAPPAGDGRGPVGVPRRAGRRRRLLAAVSGRAQPLRGSVAAAGASARRLPRAELQAS